MATFDELRSRASGIAIPTATSTSPIASQTANLRASQAATNAQLAAQNAAVTASSNPRVTSPVQQAALSSSPSSAATATPTASQQIAALRNTYVNSQPAQTTPAISNLLQQRIGAAQQASTPVAQATPAASSELQQRINAAQQAASVSKLQSKYGTEGANQLQQIIEGRQAAASQPAATTAAAAPAATTAAPAAAEAPKATMYTPTTLAAKSASATAPAATPAATPAVTTATTTTTAKPATTTTPAATTPAATTAPAVTNSPAATTTKSNSGSESVTQNVPVEYTPTGMYDLNNLRAYNEQRVADIRSIYDDALRANLASMQRAYDQNMSDAEAARDLISPQYQRSMNSLSAEYERQRRNNNMQAAANGLNTGAGSQMALAQSANYQANQAGLAAKENEALNEANRRIGDLQRNYQNAIAEATANNNYKLAASLMEEYQNAYNRQLQIENTNHERSRQMEQQNYTRSWNEDERSYSRGVDEAGRKAQYGDFSGYKDLYGDEIANLMELTWAMQNPDVAWASGKLSAEDYQALTGRTPNNPTAAEATDALGAGSGISGSGILGGSLGSYSGGGGYSSGGRSGGRSGGASGYGKGYNGPPGYYNEAGQFIVPDANGGVAASYGSAQGADRYNTNPNVNGNVSARGAKDYAEAYAKAYNSGGGSSGGSYTGGGSSGGGSSGGGNSWTSSDSGSSSGGSIIDTVKDWIGNLFG